MVNRRMSRTRGLSPQELGNRRLVLRTALTEGEVTVGGLTFLSIESERKLPLVEPLGI